MERNAVLAVVISLVILLVYQEVVLKRLYPPPPPEEQAATQAAAPGANGEAPAVLPDGETAAAEAKPLEPGRRIIVTTPLYTATFGTNGARLISFQLQKYRTSVQADSPPQETILPGQGGEVPVGVELRGGSGVTPISDAAASYAVDADGLTLATGAEGKLDFSWTNAGLTVTKHLTFRADSYEIGGRIELANVPSGYNELLLSWSRAAEETPVLGSELILEHAVHVNGKKLVQHALKDLQKGEIIEGDIRWAGYSGRHFFAGLAPVDTPNVRLWLKARDHTIEQKLLIPISGATAQVPIDMYIGPKDVDTLEKAGHDFARAVDLGWFGFIAVPLLHVLQLSHRVTGNYGFDIILLTVLIKVLFIPLTQTSMKSMQAMQKLQPQMAKIREKFKDNSEQMNKEIMELYKRHKVNPFGGCLPMVLQIPVFIGLYSALNNAVELHHAPFLLWIHDLAAPDRLGTLQLPFVQHAGIPVLTLFMGVSMFLQQWMSPAAGDPTQRQMMMLMPIMFTFMFVNFPAGLSLYWLVNNVLTIAQQYYMNRSKT
jgi:YidC/Oxa1 family membrane protein insertase